jgi:hypothetical protein
MKIASDNDAHRLPISAVGGWINAAALIRSDLRGASDPLRAGDLNEAAVLVTPLPVFRHATCATPKLPKSLTVAGSLIPERNHRILN